MQHVEKKRKMQFTHWSIEKNYDAVDAAGKTDNGSFEAVLNEGRYSLTKAVSRIDGIGGGGLYVFSYDIEMDPGVAYQAAYTWLDAQNNLLFRAHAVAGEQIICPENAESLELNICFYGFDGGRGKITNAAIKYTGEYVANKVKLAAIMVAYDGPVTMESNIQVCAERIDAAAAEGADLVLLPETYNTRGVPGLKAGQGAASTDEPSITMLRDKARQHGIYTAASVRLRDENGLASNSVVIFDRKGGFVGQYTKAHLTMGELWSGYVPGREIPTFDTELGRLGCSICWDRFMPEHARVLFMKNADIILNPTASGEYPLKEAHNGYSNAAFIVTAQTTENPELTRITGRNGQVLATADPQKGYAIAEVDVNAYDPIFWLSAPGADTDPKSVYRQERRPDLYEILTEPK